MCPIISQSGVAEISHPKYNNLLYADELTHTLSEFLIWFTLTDQAPLNIFRESISMFPKLYSLS